MSPWALVLVGCALHHRPPVCGTVGGPDCVAETGTQAVHVARGHYLSAVYAWEGGDCDTASQTLDRALLFDPGDGALLRDRGLALLDCGRQDEGLASLRRGAQAGDPRAWGELAERAAAAGDAPALTEAVAAWSALEVPLTELAWRGRLRIAAGDLAGGLADLALGLPATPDDQAGVAALLVAAAETHRYGTALGVLASLTRERGRDQGLHRALGDLATEVGDDGTARRAYEALDALKGGQDAGVALDLAYVALRTQDPALAARVAPRIVDAPDVYAGLLALTDGLAAALDALALAQAEAPRDRRLALRRAEVLAAAGQLDAALAALAAIPGLPPATLARLQAGTLAKSGDRDGALGLVVPHGSDQAAARLQVRLLLELGRPAEALQIAESGLALWPDDPLLPVRRVLALEGVGRTPEALAVALGLAERHPEDVDLALVQSRLSPPSLAGIATLQRALEAHPAEPELWLELARSEWVSGSQEAARFAAQRAGQLLGRDTPPGERYARMCAALPCTPSDPKERP